MTTEFICAFDVCSRATALRERTISFASSLAVDMSPRLAACLIDCFTFVSSFFISGVDGRGVSQGGGPSRWQPGAQLTLDLPVEFPFLTTHLLLPLLDLLLRVGRLTPAPRVRAQ